MVESRPRFFLSYSTLDIFIWQSFATCPLIFRYHFCGMVLNVSLWFVVHAFLTYPTNPCAFVKPCIVVQYQSMIFLYCCEATWIRVRCSTMEKRNKVTETTELSASEKHTSCLGAETKIINNITGVFTPQPTTPFACTWLDPSTTERREVMLLPSSSAYMNQTRTCRYWCMEPIFSPEKIVSQHIMLDHNSDVP